MRTKLVLIAGATALAVVLGSVGVAAAHPDGPKPREPARRVARLYGVVETVEGVELALATPVGAVTVVTDTNTRFHIPDREAPGLDDLEVGDVIGAGGWWGEESTFHAFVVAGLKADHVFPLAGELAGIDGRTLRVETHRGLATVRVDDETVCRIPGVERPGLDDLQVSQRVATRGTLNADGVLVARVVAAPRMQPHRRRAQGELLAVEGDTLILRVGRERRVSVLTDAETVFRVPGVENPALADLEVGDRVAGEGMVDEGGVRAALVVVLPEQVTRLNGEVTGIDGATLTAETLGGQVDVSTGADTVYRIAGIEDATLGDVAAGDRVSLVGTWENRATFDALIVAVLVKVERRPGSRGVVRGRAIDVEREGLIVGTPRGPLTVVVDADTHYRVPGVEAAGLEDVRPGAAVIVRGTWHEGATLHADAVAVLGSR